jgi:hypothetical protein
MRRAGRAMPKYAPKHSRVELLFRILLGGQRTRSFLKNSLKQDTH